MLAFICSHCGATTIYALLLQALPHKKLLTPGLGGLQKDSRRSYWSHVLPNDFYTLELQNTFVYSLIFSMFLFRCLGFGYQRNRSFLDAALQCKRETNRATNSSGQLAGRILFYNRIRDVSTDYEKIAAVEEPTIKIKRGMRFFAKAFLSVPLGRTPIGENNLPSSSPVRGRGAVLLASRPRAIAIYIKVKNLCNKKKTQTVISVIMILLVAHKNN